MPSDTPNRRVSSTPYTGRALTALLARWATTRRLTASQSSAIRAAVVATPAQPGFDWFWRLLNPTDGTAFRNARWMVETVRPPLAPAAEPFALGPLTDAPWTDWSGAWEHDDAEYQPYLRLG
ncbi:MAG: hypothetical protein U0893_22150 [Chloroflexota bacterium]